MKEYRAEERVRRERRARGREEESERRERLKRVVVMVVQRKCVLEVRKNDQEREKEGQVRGRARACVRAFQATAEGVEQANRLEPGGGILR